MLSRMDKMITSRLTYPDPFIPTGIEFDLGDDGDVTLSILDLSSQVVALVFDRVRLPAGHHETSIAHYHLRPGTYVYTLTLTVPSGSHTVTGKITLV